MLQVGLFLSPVFVVLELSPSPEIHLDKTRHDSSVCRRLRMRVKYFGYGSSSNPHRRRRRHHSGLILTKVTLKDEN